jgi:hypothetical protein
LIGFGFDIGRHAKFSSISDGEENRAIPFFFGGWEEGGCGDSARCDGNGTQQKKSSLLFGLRE